MLEEIPEQIVDYFQMKGIQPKKPRGDRSFRSSFQDNSRDGGNLGSNVHGVHNVVGVAGPSLVVPLSGNPARPYQAPQFGGIAPDVIQLNINYPKVNTRINQ